MQAPDHLAFSFIDYLQLVGWSGRAVTVGTLVTQRPYRNRHLGCPLWLRRRHLVGQDQRH
ncbi:MAG: hypothetical protein JJU06_15640 [Ectothiorhodospiraceae bacterium]|nr:hypothetical protein [Ectothiorhodospiraceae bacterium]